MCRLAASASARGFNQSVKNVHQLFSNAWGDDGDDDGDVGDDGDDDDDDNDAHQLFSNTWGDDEGNTDQTSAICCVARVSLYLTLLYLIWVGKS